MEQPIALIWNIADDVLRDVFLRGQYRDVILPMVVLRRLDALLEPTKEAVEQEYSDNNDINYTNFIEYLNGYSENVKDVLKNFEFYTKVKKLADNDRLLSIIEHHARGAESEAHRHCQRSQAR